MSTADLLYDALHVAPSSTRDRGGVAMPVDFGNFDAEYERAASRLAVHHRPYRGLIEVSGSDRQAWLSNLTTNEVTNLQTGEGNYAFVLDVKGRILFDVNVLVRNDALWVDIDLCYVEKALQHFDRYLITEDVKLVDRSADFDRWSLIGPKVGALGDDLGVPDLAGLSQLQNISGRLAGPVVLIRHDFVGVPAAEIFIPAETAHQHGEKLIDLCRDHEISPVGNRALETLRIEAGIPLLGQDIDETVLPAETLQTERAVSYGKGCFLGQEVVERMRSRGVVARKLVGIVFEGPDAPPVGAALHVAQKQAGKLTSVCHSAALGRPIGLGYLKTALADQPTELLARSDENQFPARLHPLPFTGAGSDA